MTSLLGFIIGRTMNTLALRAEKVMMAVMYVSALLFFIIGFSPLGAFIFITWKYGFSAFLHAGIALQSIIGLAWAIAVYAGVRLGTWLYAWIFEQVAEWFAERMEFAGTWKCSYKKK